MDWLQRVAESVALNGPTARVLIMSTSGPTPRAAGEAILVTAAGVQGRIGRGEVEARAVEAARQLIGEVEARASLVPQWRRQILRIKTGLVLGERSDGTIELLLEVLAAPEVELLRRARAGHRGALVLTRPLADSAPARLIAVDAPDAAPLSTAPASSMVRTTQAGVDVLIERIAPHLPRFTVYGTGMVARALVKLLADLPFETVWLDSIPANFPAPTPPGITARACPDLASAASAEPPGGFHAVMTASHEQDLAVCAALAREGTFAYLGVIGSRLKRERLLERLSRHGAAQSTLARLACPIGLGAIRSKSPAIVAIAIAAQALITAQNSSNE